MKDTMRKISPAARIALIYAVLGALWIAISDYLLDRAGAKDTLADTLKGEIFISVTALLLYLLLWNELRRRTQTEAEYRTLFETSPLPMCFCDAATLAFLEVNKAASQLYGYTREEFLGMTLKDIVPAEDVPTLMAEPQHFDPNRRYRIGAGRHRKKDGEVIEVELISHEATWQGNRAFVVTVLNLTEIHKAEQAFRDAERLQIALEKEREINETRLRFLNVVTHEFRTPLSAIMTSAGILARHLDRLSAEDRQRKIEQITQSVKVLDTMLDDMLALYRA